MQIVYELTSVGCRLTSGNLVEWFWAATRLAVAPSRDDMQIVSMHLLSVEAIACLLTVLAGWSQSVPSAENVVKRFYRTQTRAPGDGWNW